MFESLTLKVSVGNLKRSAAEPLFSGAEDNINFLYISSES